MAAMGLGGPGNRDVGYASGQNGGSLERGVIVIPRSESLERLNESQRLVRADAECLLSRRFIAAAAIVVCYRSNVRFR